MAVMPLADQVPRVEGTGLFPREVGVKPLSCFSFFFSKHFNLAKVRSRRDLNGKISQER